MRVPLVTLMRRLLLLLRGGLLLLLRLLSGSGGGRLPLPVAAMLRCWRCSPVCDGHREVIARVCARHAGGCLLLLSVGRRLLLCRSLRLLSLVLWLACLHSRWNGARLTSSVGSMAERSSNTHDMGQTSASERTRAATSAFVAVL